MTRSRRSVPNAVALSVLLALFAGCSSATVVKKSTSPRTSVATGAGVYSWDSGSGWVRSEGRAWGETDDIRRAASAAFEAEQYADALFGYQELRSRLDDTQRTEVNHSIGECYYHLGHYGNAVESYRRVYREGKPDEATAAATRQRIYEIGMDFLHRRAGCTALGIPYDCPRHGIDMLIGEDGLITEYPYLSFADDALMEIAAYYFDSREYPEAVPIYERVVSQYSAGEWARTAQYRLAMSWYLQVRGTDYDEKLISRAESEFRHYLDLDPRGPHAQDSREKLGEIKEMLAAKYLKIAKFYLRDSEPRAAQIYLGLVLNRYTNSGAAREARVIQRQLEERQRADDADRAARARESG